MERLPRNAFNLLLLLAISPLATAANCPSDVYHEEVTIKQVHDGDTVVLSDNKKVRFVGINTPEKAKGRFNAEPLAEEATEFLQNLQQQHPKWLIRYGIDRHDRYNRILAHLFLPDGTNIQSLLLEQGLAQHIVVPPNTWQKDCYAKSELQAQQAGLGVWNTARFKPLDAKKVNESHRGFYNVIGRVEKVAVRSNRIELYLSDTMVLRIDKKDRKYFKGMKPEALRSHRVRARGWIFPHGNEQHLRLRHKDMLHVID